MLVNLKNSGGEADAEGACTLTPSPGWSLGAGEPWIIPGAPLSFAFATEHLCFPVFVHRISSPHPQQGANKQPGTIGKSGLAWLLGSLPQPPLPLPWPFPLTRTREATRRLPQRKCPHRSKGSSTYWPLYTLQAFLSPHGPDGRPQPVLQGDQGWTLTQHQRTDTC